MPESITTSLCDCGGDGYSINSLFIDIILFLVVIIMIKSDYDDHLEWFEQPLLHLCVVVVRCIRCYSESFT